MGRNPAQISDFDSPGKHIIDTPLHQEAGTSFLEYAYSVIHARALPDARDGLKPVHRRILFSMHESGLRPDHAHVKCARIIGNCMGKYHPHGDSAIYEALVRMGQAFATNTPLVDPHGNFGSPNDPAAAMRYTEARLTPIAMHIVNELNENTVDMVPNYDNSLSEPTVLPSEYPYLLVNGATGIAVGMATKMPPHNLIEIIALTKRALHNPNITLEEALKIVPGPDFPTGGTVLGVDGITDAYRTGKGTIRIRATAHIETLAGSRGRQAITITSLPYEIGTEKVIETIKAEIAKKKLEGISDVKDLTDRTHGIRLQIECKSGINPEALLDTLYKTTPLEVTFGIANLALVDQTPQTLGLLDLIHVFITHRRSTVTRRTQHRLDKALDRLHIVDGLLIALENIDAIVQLIKDSKTSTDARQNLTRAYDLTETQAIHILDMPLRRIVSLEIATLKEEHKDLKQRIATYQEILDNPATLTKIIDNELTAIGATYGTPRKSTITTATLKDTIHATPPQPLHETNVPCYIHTTPTGAAYRHSSPQPVNPKDIPAQTITTTTHATVLVITTAGKAHRVPVIDLPTSAPGTPLTEFATLTMGEKLLTIIPQEHPNENDNGVFLATTHGTVKVTTPEWPTRSDTFDLITLSDNDTLVTASWTNPTHSIVLITTDAQLLTFPSTQIRPQGRNGSGITGIRLNDHATVIAAHTTPTDPTQKLVTHTGHTTKITPLTEYPTKGRATGGVRCHRFVNAPRLSRRGFFDYLP